MGHQRQVDFIGRLEGQFQCAEPEVAGDDAADAHLHPDDAVAVLFDLVDAPVHRQHGPRRGLADRDVPVEAEDAGERDVEEGEDAVGRMRHDVVAEAVIVARAGAARVDQRRARRAPGDEARVDAQRSRLVVDVGVDVDEPGRDDRAAHVAHLGAVGVDRCADRGDLAALDRHVEMSVHAVAFVDDATALQDEVIARRVACGCHLSLLIVIGRGRRSHEHSTRCAGPISPPRGRGRAPGSAAARRTRWRPGWSRQRPPPSRGATPPCSGRPPARTPGSAAYSCPGCAAW